MSEIEPNSTELTAVSEPSVREYSDWELHSAAAKFENGLFDEETGLVSAAMLRVSEERTAAHRASNPSDWELQVVGGGALLGLLSGALAMKHLEPTGDPEMIFEMSVAGLNGFAGAWLGTKVVSLVNRFSQ